MPGLVPGIHVLLPCGAKDVDGRDKPGHDDRKGVADMAAYVYFMTNRRNGILYVGVTTNLPARAYQHREGRIAGFTKRYGLKMLVYYEVFDDVRDAIQREKMIKHWPRAWKVRLIHQMNPAWHDLYDSLF
jgi:putative endonuclease